MVKQLFKRVISLTLRMSSDQLVRAALRLGQRSAIDTALGVATNAVPIKSERIYTQVFHVEPPTTVYVRASHCRVTVRHAEDSRVQLEANVQRMFGIEFATDQDEDGVYIIARRKPIVGTVSRTDFTLTVPHNTHLAFNLSPGDVVFEQVSGIAEIPADLLYASAQTHANNSDKRDQ